MFRNWHWRSAAPPGLFLLYQLAVLGGLAWLLLRYAVTAPSSIVSFSFARVLPLWVPLGGALGGSTISLVGIAKHAWDWDGQRYAFWHLVRPILGMICGSVAVLILLFVLKGVAPDVIPPSGAKYSAGGIAVLFVISFVVGYREETFRELVSRVVDVILGPGDADQSARGVLAPALLTLSSDAGAQASGTVMLVNTSGDTWSVTQGMLKISPASFAAALDDPGSLSLAPNSSAPITVTWNPAPGTISETGTLTASAGGLTLSSTVTGTVS